MKKYLKYIFVFVCVIILLTSTAAANDTLDEYREDAQMLNNIGFMQGDDGGMRLFDELNRAEAATLLCRAYGGELEAKYYEHKFTFTDVPDWAIPYVAYMSENGIIRGRTAEVFDPFASVTMQEFYTMLLRMLGYSDADGDFEYAKVLDFAKSIDLISDEDIDIVKNRFFCRIDAAHAVVSALRQPCKGSELTLAESRASYIDSSYDMELAKVVLGEHEVYNQMEKTRKAMSMAESFTMTQVGRYDIDETEGEYERDVYVDSVVKSDLNGLKANITINVDNKMDGETVDNRSVEIFCRGDELYYMRADTNGWIKDENVSSADVENYCRIYDLLFGFGSGILYDSEVYTREDGIHIVGFDNVFAAVGDITSKQIVEYYYDIDILIDPSTNLYKSVTVTYSDVWKDNYGKLTDVDFVVEYEFTKYGRTKVDVKVNG